jgi:hypothetical protein
MGDPPDIGLSLFYRKMRQNGRWQPNLRRTFVESVEISGVNWVKMHKARVAYGG